MTLARRHIAIWVAALIATAGVRASSPGFTEDGVRKLCGIAGDLTDVAGLAKAKLRQQATELEAAINARTVLTLAAINADSNEEAAIYATAAESAESCSTAAASRLELLTTKAIAATRAAANAAGRLTGVVEILLETTNQDKQAGKCIVQEDSGDKTELTKLEDLGCPTTTDAEPQPKMLTDLENLKKTGFPKLNGEIVLTATTTATNVCAFLASGNGDKSNLWDNSGGNDKAATIAHGILKLKFAQTNAKATAQTAKLNELGDWGEEADGENARLFKAIGALETTQVHNCGRDTQGAVKTFLSTQTLKPLLANAYKQTTQSAALEQATKTINKAAKKDDTTADDLKTLIDKVAIPKLNNGQLETKPLNQLNYDVTGKGHLLSSLLQLKAKSDPSTICAKFKPSDGGASSTEEDETCQKKGTENNCKDGCKEVTENGEKKCVVDKKEAKKGEGGENDRKTGSTASTTGNNSFVINKAQLWLAVLLF